MHAFLNLFLHLDSALGGAISAYGLWIYAVLFVVVFCETGLVVTPFLPGDSLLFAAGAFAAAGALNVAVVWLLLFVAAALGDAVNYRIGLTVGAHILEKGSFAGLPVKQEYADATQRYYHRYGAKTIVLARFMPFIRTFAPFVAGLGRMPAAVFSVYNLISAAAWTSVCVFAGYFFGNIPAVKAHFEIVVLSIILVSLLPAVIGLIRERRRS